MNEPKHTEKYKHFNHHHELTDEHQMVDFGDGEFIANKAAIPLLKALNDLELRTRTHHVDDNGGFFSILIDEDKDLSFSFQHVNERDSNRTKYNGMSELLIHWRNPKEAREEN